MLLKDSMHNAYLYAFLSGGIFGFIIIIIIVVLGIVQIVKKLRTQINKNDDIYFNITSNILIILILRGLLETSFAIFGIDYILFILSIYFIYQKREISRSEAKILL